MYLVFPVTVPVALKILIWINFSMELVYQDVTWDLFSMLQMELVNHAHQIVNSVHLMNLIVLLVVVILSISF